MEKIPHTSAHEEWHEALKGLVEGTPDAFCILSGPSRFHEERGYVPSSFSVGDENSKLAMKEGRIDLEKLGVFLTPEEIEQVKERGVPAGGNDRVIATALMHEVFPDAKLATVTRPRSADEPTYATINEKGLLQRGVRESNILSQGEDAVAIDTITEFKEFARMWREYGWTNIVFILSEWHIPRAGALFNHIEDFVDQENEDQKLLIREFTQAIRNGALMIQFLDSTAVLSNRSSKFATFFEEKLANDPGMSVRVALETAAVEQIKAGSYGGRTLTHKIWEDKA